MLNDNELIKLIEQGESERVEFTSSVKDLDKICKAICAFANDLPNHNEPGVIFIGINDDKSCANLDINDALLRELGGLKSDGKILPFPTMSVTKKELQHCEIAIIQVEPSDNPPVKVDSRCWIRVGPRRGTATAEDERRLTEKRHWRQLPHDMYEMSGTSIHDIDMQKFTQEYLPHVVSPEVLEENKRNPEEQMQSLRLLTSKNIPTVMALLMLGKDIRYWFPGAYIQFVRFEGNKVSDPIKNHEEINGTLPDQLRQLDSVLKTNISVSLDTSGTTHLELPDYPYQVLRELVSNAIIHRNYQSHTPVRVYWFANKSSISSPGGVYGEVTKENFGTGITSYRNPTIAEAIKNMGFMQKFGRGLVTVREELNNNGNPPADFDISEKFISVTIKKRK